MHRALTPPVQQRLTSAMTRQGGTGDSDPRGPRVASGGDRGGVALWLLRIRPELPRGPLGRTCRSALG